MTVVIIGCQNKCKFALFAVQLNENEIPGAKLAKNTVEENSVGKLNDGFKLL